MTLRERVEWLSRMAFLVFILASAAFLSAITAMRIAIHGREVSMPNLVGKDVGEASRALRAKGLILRVADRVYSDVPVNQVVRQTPSPGMLMKVSQQAHVVLSLGERNWRFRRSRARRCEYRELNCCAMDCRSARFPALPCPTKPVIPFCSKVQSPGAGPQPRGSMSWSPPVRGKRLMSCLI